MITVERAEDVGLDSTRLARIEEFFDRTYIQPGLLPGMVVAVSRRGEIAYSAAFGQRDLEEGRPMTSDTIFRIYSMTKPITSVALMTLYEQGLFQLDDPVSRFIPAFADLRVWQDGTARSYSTQFPEREMTIKDLLTHTSGLTYGFMERHPVDELYRRGGVDRTVAGATLESFVDKLAEVPLMFSPGTRWSYSVATDVVGRLVELMSGRTLDEYFQREIFEPLGMVDTGFSVPADKLDRMSACYTRMGDQVLARQDGSDDTTYAEVPTFLSGGGGLVSTAADYQRFAQMMLNNGILDGKRILGRRTIDYMTANHLPGGGDLTTMGQKVFSETPYDGIGFGLGFSVVLDPTASNTISSVGEYAWGGAASTMFWVDPVEELTVIGLTQYLPSSTYPIRREMRSLTYQAIID